MEGGRREEKEGRRLEMGKEEKKGEERKEKEKREKRFEERLVLTGLHTLYSKFPRGQS